MQSLRVSILVLMEMVFLHLEFAGQRLRAKVSILVLMEMVFLPGSDLVSSSLSSYCFNPCFDGNGLLASFFSFNYHFFLLFQSLF